MHEVEENSIFSTETVRKNDKKMKIIQKSKQSAKVLTWITILSITAVCISFDTIPLMRTIFSQAESEKSQNIDCSTEIFKYLVFVMWLPGDFCKGNWYWYLYTIQVLVLGVACAYLTAVLPFLLTLIIYTETQFRLVTSSLNEIDERYKLAGTDTELFETGREFSNSEHAGGTDDVRSLRPEEMQASNSTELSEEPDDFALSVGRNNSEESHVTSEEFDVASSYLVECIKLHQAVIE
jgi:hypothetical protein